MDMYNGIIMLYSRSEHNTVNQLYFNKINFLKINRNSWEKYIITKSGKRICIINAKRGPKGKVHIKCCI